MQTLYKYGIEGILTANITQDGGLTCYNQIPRSYHITVVICFSILHSTLLYKYHSHLSSQIQLKQPSIYEFWLGGVGLLIWLLTAVSKLLTFKGIFMFNPCHITLLLQCMLLLNQSTKFMHQVHTIWSSWLFGAIVALTLPHLQGLSLFQMILYLLEHLTIFPFGIILLYNRYGFIRPTIKNHLAAFSTFTLYQLIVLTGIGWLSMINLNFSLCHSHADPTYILISHHYYAFAIFALNFTSYCCRWMLYLTIKVYCKLYYEYYLNLKNNFQHYQRQWLMFNSYKID